MVFCIWCQDLPKRLMDWEPEAIVKNERAYNFRTSRWQRCKGLKFDSTHHSVRNCMSFAPGEEEFLSNQRRLRVEKLWRIRYEWRKCRCVETAGKSRLRWMNRKNIKTLLYSGSDCRIIFSVGLVNIMSSKTFLCVKELKWSLKKSTVVASGTSPIIKVLTTDTVLMYRKAMSEQVSIHRSFLPRSICGMREYIMSDGHDERCLLAWSIGCDKATPEKRQRYMSD